MKNFSIAIFAALLVLIISSVFVINEGQRGIVFQFSKIKRDSNTQKMLIYDPGLHFKIPFIESVRKFDARIQTLDEAPDRFVTAEKKDLMVDSYAKWKIIDFSTFFLRTSGSVENAKALLKQKINNGLRTEFGSRTIKEIVSGDRSIFMSKALESAKSSQKELGIKVIDVRVKAINLPVEVSHSIYERMRAERTVVAKEHRSKGQEQSEIIRAKIDAKITVMLASAQKNASTIRGEGDALAAKVYADSYTKDPEFYAFYRSLNAYKNTFNSKNDIMVVKPNSEFFHYFKNGDKSKK